MHSKAKENFESRRHEVDEFMEWVENFRVGCTPLALSPIIVISRAIGKLVPTCSLNYIGNVFKYRSRMIWVLYSIYISDVTFPSFKMLFVRAKPPNSI